MRVVLQSRLASRWEVALNVCKDGSVMSNRRILDEFKVMSERREESTSRKYDVFLSEFADWLFRMEEQPLVAARRQDVMRFMAYLKTDERAVLDQIRRDALPDGAPTKKHTPRKGNLSASTRKGALAAVRQLWKHFAVMNYVEHDATSGIETPQITTLPGLTLDEEKIRTFLDAPGSERDRVQAYLLVFTAARSGALRKLRWEHIDFATGEIEIHEKRGKVARIPMHAELYGSLRRWQQAQQREAQKHFALRRALDETASAFVLLTRNGRPLAQSTIAKQVKWRAARVGIELHGRDVSVGRENKSALHPHALRRSWASVMLNSGKATLGDIADMLQHESIQTTRKHYAFSSNERRRLVAEAFSV